MNPLTLRRVALSASAIVAMLAVAAPAATFAADGCQPISVVYPRDGSTLTTAARVGGNITGEVDATGCDIGVYNPASVSNANIHGAKYLGIVVDGKKADVKGSRIHDIGDLPIGEPGEGGLRGMQRGEGIYYMNGARGTISGNTVSKFQKNGISARDGGMVTIKNNTVTGLGHIDFIGQNGILVRGGTSAVVQGNTVSRFDYTPDGDYACGIYFLNAGTIQASKNSLFDNEKNICDEGRDKGHVRP